MTDSDGLLRAHLAAPARTLVDVLSDTAGRHPDALALDDGRGTLTYAELVRDVRCAAAALARAGVGPGSRVGVRIPSGTVELYVAILAVLWAGAAYVPVDVDDPDERADLVFTEAGVSVILAEGDLATEGAAPDAEQPGPGLDDDAWIIFTSGSTGTPKGVAVTHRSAAAFVDAEARLFVQARPLGPGDRVLAGLSVAFDASCEEMWLAWRHGACLVPAPRALVRTGADLGPWLVSQGITVISTVPTLAGMWAPDQLEGVRLLIFGGEACPPELAARLVTPGREVWNTYGPTEATVVACAALLDGVQPVRIGLPLDGWDLAVIDRAGNRVPAGEVGELVIGGVGLARYLDAARDADKYASAPGLGWDRAYRSGDFVRFDGDGLVFVGRADDQVKVGGRRIELGEVDAALLGLPGVAAAAAAVKKTEAGASVLVGYLVAEEGADLDLADARARIRTQLPAALVPLLAVVEQIPTRTSGKVDREALPWPLDDVGAGAAPDPQLTTTEAWIGSVWTALLGVRVAGPRDDFFASGGGSLLAAQLVSRLRERFPTASVADVYDYPALGDLALRLEELAPAPEAADGELTTVPRMSQLIQTVLMVPLAFLVGARWLTWLLLITTVATASGAAPWLTPIPYAWAWGAVGWLLFICPLGRMGTTVAVARSVLRPVVPGRYPRGGSVHLRLWFAESWAAAAGAGNLSCAPWTVAYARMLGATVGKEVDLHAPPPITGHLILGARCAIEPEVDLSGHWLEGDVLVVGKVRVDKRATVGTRTVLGPGSRVGQGAEIAPGSAVTGSVPPGERWAGSPAQFEGPARADWPGKRAPRARAWAWAYPAGALAIASLPVVAAASGGLAMVWGIPDDADTRAAIIHLGTRAPLGALVAFGVLLVVTLGSVRLLGRGTVEGYHPVRSSTGWRIWATLRLMDEARRTLYPIYSSWLTASWLRALGADMGRGVEASTVLMLPAMTKVGDDAFLADDTLIGSYELGRGWMRVESARVGARAFLGNSGMIAPGRVVPKRGLVAVLSATPKRAKAGTSWLGSPPQELRRVGASEDATNTYAPHPRLRLARALVEAARALAVAIAWVLGTGLLIALYLVWHSHGLAAAAVVAPVAVLAGGLVAVGVAALAKWALVGRTKAGEHALWSAFIWRNELADTFLEVVAIPWLAPGTMGSPALAVVLRLLGARIGRGVWCETYWLPEADLVSIGDGASVNRGCVLQTHLFHDRVMSMDTVMVEAGSSLGPHGVVLPASRLGAGAHVGPVSLVLRGDQIPARSRWTGNPVGPQS